MVCTWFKNVLSERFLEYFSCNSFGKLVSGLETISEQNLVPGNHILLLSAAQDVTLSLILSVRPSLFFLEFQMFLQVHA